MLPTSLDSTLCVWRVGLLVLCWIGQEIWHPMMRQCRTDVAQTFELPGVRLPFTTNLSAST